MLVVQALVVLVLIVLALVVLVCQVVLVDIVEELVLHVLSCISACLPSAVRCPAQAKLSFNEGED